MSRSTAVLRSTATRRLIVAVLAILLIAAGAHRGCRRVSTGPADGTRLCGEATPPAASRKTIRVATFNIHGCKGADRRRDVERVAACLEDFDLIGLNEVHGETIWPRGDQAAALGRRLEMAWLYAPASLEWGHHQFGNALLSRLPVVFWQRIPLARRFDHSYRNIVLATIEHRRRTIHVVIAHVVRRDDRERQAQLRAAIALFTALDEPAILLGDLNANADDPQLRRLLARADVVDPLGEVLGPDAPEHIDWILVRGLEPTGAGTVDRGASDHPMIWAELALEP